MGLRYWSLLLYCVYFTLESVNSNDFSSSQDACKSKLCRCQKSTMLCDHVNTSYIPKPPNYIQFIIFKNGYLPSISLDTFKYVIHAKKRIQRLSLINNGIKDIAKNSFKLFTHVHLLDLSYNNLTLSSLYNLMSDLKHVGGLSMLNLNNTGLDNPPSDLFNDLAKSHLHKLHISGNNFPTLNFSMFKPISKLTKLCVMNSNVKTVIPAKLKNLLELYLSSNKLKEIPRLCKGNVSMTPELLEIMLHRNVICRYIPEYLNCLTHLTKINLQRNCIGEIGTGFFSNLKSLNMLVLNRQRNPNEQLGLKSHAFNNSKLWKIYLDDNGMFSKFIDPLAFAGCTNLDILSMSRNHLRDYRTTRSTKLNTILSYITSLSELDLSNGFLYDIPEVVQRMTRLRQFFFRQNFIKSWPDGFFDQNPKLEIVDFTINKIETVTQEMFDFKLRKKLKVIKIGLNPLVCNCQLVWFINWIRENKKIFYGYPEQFRCANITERICYKDSALYTSVTALSCMLIIVFILVTGIYKYRWHIKYQIYIWRHQPKQKMTLTFRTYLYDVFVSYCSEDSDWVIDILLPKLEEEENLKLCVHERDFNGGRLIIDNIVESLENSRRVLIVLSNEFAKRDWCQFEVTLAQKLVLNENMAPLTVVLLEDIDSANMTNTLSALLKTTTYITWDEQIEHSHLFWNRLKRSL